MFRLVTAALTVFTVAHLANARVAQPRYSWGNGWGPTAAVTETVTENVSPPVAWPNPWAQNVAVTDTVSPNWLLGNLWAPKPAVTETVTENVTPRWGWGSNPWGQNVAISETETVSPSWGWGQNLWGSNAARWGANPWAENVAVSETVSPSAWRWGQNAISNPWGWGLNPWGQNVAISETETVSPSWGWGQNLWGSNAALLGANPWAENVAISETVSPSAWRWRQNAISNPWGWGSNPWGQNVAISETETVSPSWGWGQNLWGSNAARLGANPWAENVAVSETVSPSAWRWGQNAISNPWGWNSASGPSAALTEVVNTGSAWGPNSVITETVNNPWGQSPNEISLNGPLGNLIPSLSISQPLNNNLQQALQLQLANVFGSPYGRQAVWQTFGPTIQETLVAKLIQPVEPAVTDQLDINTPALPYCSSLVLADDTYLYLLQRLNYVLPTGPQRSLSALLAAFTALAESLAQGLDYDTAYNSESLIVSVAELQPAAARDHVLQVLQSAFLKSNPIRVLVNEFLINNGKFNAADVALCDRKVDAFVRANPSYQSSAALVIEEGRLAQKLLELKPELEAVSLQGAEQQFLANAKYVVRNLILELAAVIQLVNLV